MLWFGVVLYFVVGFVVVGFLYVFSYVFSYGFLYIFYWFRFLFRGCLLRFFFPVLYNLLPELFVSLFRCARVFLGRSCLLCCQIVSFRVLSTTPLLALCSSLSIDHRHDVPNNSDYACNSSKTSS